MNKTFMVYNRYTLEVEFEGSIEKCHDFIANYGGGWWALEIGPKYSAEVKGHILTKEQYDKLKP